LQQQAGLGVRVVCGQEGGRQAVREGGRKARERENFD
jgi:hypothetical protein